MKSDGHGKVPENPSASSQGDGSYRPNHISAAVRWAYGITSGVMLLYCAYGLWIDDLFIPGRQRRRFLGKHSGGLHLDGIEAWLMTAAVVCAASVMLSIIVDHYDKRDNERNYRRFVGFAFAATWLFFFSSMIMSLINAGMD